jgi:RNA polymerase sigma factor (sigma-70 family)
MEKTASCEISRRPTAHFELPRYPADTCISIVSCERLIQKLVAGHVSRRHPDYDDLCQLGRIAAMNAASSFSAEKGKPFTYARTVISNAILAERRTTRKRMRRERLVDFREVGRQTSASDLHVYQPETQVSEFERRDMLTVAKGRISAWLCTLAARDRQIIELVFYTGLSKADVARRTGLTRARVCQIVSQLLMSARVHLNSLSEFN